MSEYFRVLKRIENDRGGQTAARRDLVEVRRGTRRALTVLEAPGTEPRTAVPVADMSPAAEAAFAVLFDNLRALTRERSTRSFVFAPASPAESVRAVTTGLIAHAERLGLNAALAELTDSKTRSLLRLRPEQRRESGESDDPPPLDLSVHADLAEVSDWLEVVARESALIVIEGQPLTQAIDSALLARACDGLVIVAETQVTARQALRVAADKARVAGCRTLGVVLYGTNDRMPGWIKRLTQEHQLLRVPGE